MMQIKTLVRFYHSSLMALTVSSLLLMTMAATASAADEPETMKLKLKPIKHYPFILTKTDVDFDKPFQPVKLRDGIILPPQMVRFSGSPSSASLTIGETEVLFERNSKNITMLVNEDKDPLKPLEAGFRPLMLELADESKYALAFPYWLNYRRSGKLELFVRPACALEGRIGSDKIYLFYNNMDGKYTIEDDMYTLGKGMIYAPLTEYIATGRNIIHIDEIDPAGESLTYTELDPEETGSFSIKFVDKRLDAHMAIVSEDGSLSFIDQGREKRTSVTPGKYQMQYGFVFSPKDSRCRHHAAART